MSLVVLLLITNPSLRDFKDNGHGGYCHQESNWLIFSFFTSHGDTWDETYVGVCKNFFQVSGYSKPYQIKEYR